MSSLKHNKKRNVGLLNEFFARYMAKSIIEHQDSRTAKAKELIAKHFHKGTDLYRELKVFAALFETKLTSREAAVSLVERAKQACKLQSQAKIDLEKSALLHEINLYLGDPGFFDQEIPEYRDYATVQVLLNHWRGGLLTENLSEIAQLEDKLLRRLLDKGTICSNSDVLRLKESDVDGLVVNLMTEKLNKKFSSALNENQKKLLQLYVFSKDNEETKTSLVEMLDGLKNRTLAGIERALRFDKDSPRLHGKFAEIRSMLQEDYRDTKNPDDRMVTFYMTVSKLEEELGNE